MANRFDGRNVVPPAPPPGYRWSLLARFEARGRRLTTDATECYGCGFRRGAHGPQLECPERV